MYCPSPWSIMIYTQTTWRIGFGRKRKLLRFDDQKHPHIGKYGIVFDRQIPGLWLRPNSDSSGCLGIIAKWIWSHNTYTRIVLKCILDSYNNSISDCINIFTVSIPVFILLPIAPADLAVLTYMFRGEAQRKDHGVNLWILGRVLTVLLTRIIQVSP